MSKKVIRIGSRESRLAVIQSEILITYLKQELPEAEISLVTMKTAGDKILNRTLDEVGGKGLFVKELDAALIAGRTDLSVHSLKDLPMEILQELPVVAFSKREDSRDVLVLPAGAAEIDFSKPVGTSSRRRMLQLKEMYPQADFAPIRGNVQTRLRKLDEGQYGALILAAAGLKRLGLEHRISRYFAPEEMLPAAGQGILAIQGRTGEDYSYLAGFHDPKTAAAAIAERSFVQALGGGCSAPTAAYAKIADGRLILTGMDVDKKSGKCIRSTIKGSPDRAEELGRELAAKFSAGANGRRANVQAENCSKGL